VTERFSKIKDPFALSLSDDGGGEPAAGRRLHGDILLRAAAAALIVTAFGLQIWLLKVYPINLDEFEHLHAAWCLSRGVFPYRDFFEIHAPWLYFLLAPLMPPYHVASSPDGAIAFIFFARRIELTLTSLALGLSFLLAWMWRGPRVAWIATALLATTAIFAAKMLEIRPDVLALVLWLGCLCATLRAFDLVSRGAPASLWFVVSGMLLGGVMMSTQKYALALPGFGLAMLWYLFGGRGEFRTRLSHCVLQFAGFCAPILATAIFMSAHGALEPFFRLNFVKVLRLSHRFRASHLWFRLILGNPFLVGLGLLGLLRELLQVRPHRGFSADHFVLLNTIGLLANSVVNNPYAQYALSFLPLLAMFAALFLIYLIELVTAQSSRRRRWSAAAIFAMALGVAAAGVLAGGTLIRFGLGSALTLTLAAAVVMIPCAADVALALLLIVVGSLPMAEMTRHVLLHPNPATLERLRFVIANTSPDDTVMDGWTGLGVFRTSATFYPFFNHQFVAMMPKKARLQVLADLQSGEIAPQMIFLDKFLSKVTSGIDDYVRQHYDRVEVDGSDLIWKRRGGGGAGR